MSLLQLSSVLLLAILAVSVTCKDLIYYNTITHLTRKTFVGQDVQNVVFLDLRDCDIEDVASTTFSGMTKLTHLLLLHNNIDHLPEEVFNSLENNLDVLLLDSNKLQNIPNKLFAKLPKLQELSISNNLLSKLETGTFDKNVKLKKISLQYNRLENIPERLFSKLTELVHLDLSNNFIAYIDDTALPNNLQNLLVFSNRLRFINENHVNNLKRLVLDKNPLHCDCRLKQVYTKWANEFKNQGWTPHCAGPKNLNNIRWDKLSSNNFVCKNEIVTLYPKVTEIPVIAGESVTISCHISGNVNQQDVKFTYGNNTEVTNQLQIYKHPFSIQFNYMTSSLWYNLTIFNVQKFQEKMYKCVVKNEHEMDVKVRVRNPI